MKNDLIEAGEIVNTHGIHGEVKINPWCDSPDFLLPFREYYIDGTPIRVRNARIHKGCVLATLEGVGNVNAAMLLRGKTVFVEKAAAKLEDGQYFIADLIGLDVYDNASESIVGQIADVINLPANDVYVVRDGESEFMIPVVSEFVHCVSLSDHRVTVTLIPGMRGDAPDEN